jgi:PAS domain S-box-containing protein
MSSGNLLDQVLLQAIVESIPHGVVLFQPHGSIVFANRFAEHLLGFDPGEWRDVPIASLFLEEDREILLPNIIKLTRNQGSFAAEALLRNRKNQRFFALLSTSVYRHGETGLFIAAIQDIGALKSLQRHTRESDRLRCMGKVVDQMAHHIRNPIAAIGGFAARLLRTGLSEKDQRLYQEIIFQEADRLECLLKSLADFSNLQLPSLAEESLDQLLDRALTLVPESLKSRATSWDTPAAEELRPLTAFMDMELMAACVANVVTNALESAHPMVVITIQATARDNQLHLKVLDNGIGITAQNLPSIFDPLFTTKDGHVGLGLTISQRIIEDHAGTIGVQSEVGRGTTVTMAIPQERRRPIRLRRL